MPTTGKRLQEWRPLHKLQGQLFKTLPGARCLKTHDFCWIHARNQKNNNWQNNVCQAFVVTVGYWEDRIGSRRFWVAWKGTTFRKENQFGALG